MPKARSKNGPSRRTAFQAVRPLVNTKNGKCQEQTKLRIAGAKLPGESGAKVEDGLFDGRVDGEMLVEEGEDGDRGRGRTLIPWSHLR